MYYTRQLCCVSLLCLSGSAVAADARLQVEGLSGQLEKNVRAQFSTIENDGVTPDRCFHARVNDAIREGLKALGYCQPTIRFDLRPPPKKERQILIAKVAPGVPVLIDGTDVVLRDGTRTDKDYLKLFDTHPAIGMVLNQDDYESFKKPLTSIVSRKDYFDSEFTKAQLDVALGLHRAFQNIDYNSGECYRFRHVTLEGSQVHDECLQNLMPFKEDGEYESEDLAELNRRPFATGQFSSVVVAP